jgi:arginyl-tRNA synthetase
MSTTIDYFINIIHESIIHLYFVNFPQLEIQYTNHEHTGYITVIIYPLLNVLNFDINLLGTQICILVKFYSSIIKSFNIIKGFLNFDFIDYHYLLILKKINKHIIPHIHNKGNIMVEYSSPNSNKPLHIGHIRNNLIGASISKLLDYSGIKVIKTQIINDRGIHICKSMIAWILFSNGETHNFYVIKGDHLVGKYYVMFEKEYNKEILYLGYHGYTKYQAINEAPIIKSAYDILCKWENKDMNVRKLWKKLNNWVYQGFKFTYHSLGVYFDDTQYESQNYLVGNKLIEEGLKKNVFFKKFDQSVWIDLSNEGLDEKLILRYDGTSLYITQDIGTVMYRLMNYNVKSIIYVVGEEQIYHFKVLFFIINSLGYTWKKKYMIHLYYGMVNLPTGKMKSREGTVVYADSIIQEIYQYSKKCFKQTTILSKQNIIFKIIGLGALKYHILKVDPKKKMVFNTKSSIDFIGSTGTYIQYTYARIRSIERNAKKLHKSYNNIPIFFISEYEKQILQLLEQYIKNVYESAMELNPSIIANYAYTVAKKFNDFYQNKKIINANENYKIAFRIILSSVTGNILKLSMYLLGITLPERL